MNNLSNRPDLNEAVYLARPSASAGPPAARGSRRNFAVLAVAGSSAALAIALTIALAGGALRDGSSTTGEAPAKGGMTAPPDETAARPADEITARAATQPRPNSAIRPMPQGRNEELQTLDADSSRWGAGEEALAEGARKAQAIMRSVLADRLDDGAGGAEAVALSYGSPTAAIDAAAVEAVVPVAKTEAEVAALEETMEESAPPVADEGEQGNILASPEAFDRPMEQAYATEHVNMRYGPDKDAGVAAVVPKGARIQAADCEHWCAVVYDGKRGWVYKSYIGSDGNQAQKTDPQPAANDTGKSGEAQNAAGTNGNTPPVPATDPFQARSSGR